MAAVSAHKYNSWIDGIISDINQDILKLPHGVVCCLTVKTLPDTP